jgi:hypothetical protein
MFDPEKAHREQLERLQAARPLAASIERSGSAAKDFTHLEFGLAFDVSATPSERVLYRLPFRKSWGSE